MRQLVCIASIALMVAACGGAKSRNQSVWDLYDVRYPVPAGSSVPVSRATIYDRYNTLPAQQVPVDNDSFYKQPTAARSTPADIWDLN